jgi:hypothetical protein
MAPKDTLDDISDLAKPLEDISDLAAPVSMQSTQEQKKPFYQPLLDAGAKIAQANRAVNAEPNPVLRYMKAANADFGALGGAAGGTLGTLGNLYKAYDPRGAQAVSDLAGKAGQTIGNIFQNPQLQQAGAAFGETGIGKALYPVTQNPYVQQSAELAGNVAGMIPIGKGVEVGLPLAERYAGLNIENTGNALSNIAKSNLVSGAKLKDVTARQFSSNVATGAKQYADLVEKHNLESPMKGFAGISEKAQSAIDEHMVKADEILKQAAKANPGLSANPTDVALKFMDDISTGKEKSFLLDPDRANSIVDKIHRGLETMGLAGNQPVEKLPQVKTAIREMVGGFTKGAPNIAAEPYVKQVGDIYYLRMKQALEDKVPEIAEYNNAIHDLINVKNASDEAAKRIGNKNKIGLNDWASLIGLRALFPEGGKVSNIQLPLIGAPVIAAKLASGGRGSSALLSAGRGMQTLGQMFQGAK